MKAFCISFHKSGTSSLHAWFGHAGFSSLHYPKHVHGVNHVLRVLPVIHDNDLALDALAPLICAFDAHSDAPWPGLYPELACRQQDARFVLLRREPDEWWESLARDWQIDWIARRMSAYEWLQYRRTLPLHPRTLITRRHRDQFIAAYRAHYARAQQDISPARLLAMDIDDPQKSEKLSAFFGLRDEIPFPHCMPASQAKPWIKSLRSLRRRMFGSDLHHAIT